MTIELRTGTVREHRREDYITKIAGCPINKNCQSPLWNTFLDTVLPDKDVQSYLQRVCGYCMTGVITEHVLFFFYGTGANGKGVFLNTIRAIWNDYAATAPIDMFIESKVERHPTELARLRGVRLVIAQELERNQRWAESKIKALTGGDQIAARFMRQDHFEFWPKFKLMIAGNHKPSLRGVDQAMRRRIHLIHFGVTIPPHQRDKELGDKLKAERPGILAWALEGCLQWQKIGLAPPKAVLDDTERYFEEQDSLGQWLDERCNVNSTAKTLSSTLYVDWTAWAFANGLPAGSNKSFTQALADRGFQAGHTKKGSQISGLELRAQNAQGGG